ncbi:hypothetical protein [Aphanothece hegewaldii]|nr:hypothetical protein [Aphanothece hegewaldii]
MIELQKKVFERRGGESFDPPLDYYISEARDERNQQIDAVMRICFHKEQQ